MGTERHRRRRPRATSTGSAGGYKIPRASNADWTAAASGRGKIVRGAGAYFERTEPPRGVRIGDKNYIAVTGCVPATCRVERVLLLIQEGGEALQVRLDEGGFSHYYAYGGDWGVAGSTARTLDAALRALSRSGDPYPRA